MFPGERPQGVRIPDSQLRGDERGTPNTVGHIMPLRPYAIQYFDEHGAQHSTVVYIMGDGVYYDLNAERWAGGLRPAAGYISKAVLAEHAVLHSAAAPENDSVDVIAAEEASGKTS